MHRKKTAATRLWLADEEKTHTTDKIYNMDCLLLWLADEEKRHTTAASLGSLDLLLWLAGEEKTQQKWKLTRFITWTASSCGLLTKRIHIQRLLLNK